MGYWTARSEGTFGKMSSVRHLIEADRIVTGELDSHNFPLFLKTAALCGREARADGIQAWRGTKSLCVQVQAKGSGPLTAP